MSNQIIQTDAFRIIGIKTRTTNAIEFSGQGSIGKLWADFYSQNCASKITNKISENIYSLYYDYESDAMGEYSVLVGFKVHSNTKPPEGFVAVDVPAQKHAVITSAKGEAPAVIIQAWQTVWQLATTNKIDRSYKYDLEVYDQRSHDPKNVQIDILISVK